MRGGRESEGLWKLCGNGGMNQCTLRVRDKYWLNECLILQFFTTSQNNFGFIALSLAQLGLGSTMRPATEGVVEEILNILDKGAILSSYEVVEKRQLFYLYP